MPTPGIVMLYICTESARMSIQTHSESQLRCLRHVGLNA